MQTVVLNINESVSEKFFWLWLIVREFLNSDALIGSLIHFVHTNPLH